MVLKVVRAGHRENQDGSLDVRLQSERRPYRRDNSVAKMYMSKFSPSNVGHIRSGASLKTVVIGQVLGSIETEVGREHGNQKCDEVTETSSHFQEEGQADSLLKIYLNPLKMRKDQPHRCRQFP